MALSTMAWNTGCTSVGEDCDHLEDIGAAGLVGQRLREIARPGLHFVEQPRILDGDHGLVGKGPEQLDVMRCERTGFPSA